MLGTYQQIKLLIERGDFWTSFSKDRRIAILRQLNSAQLINCVELLVDKMCESLDNNVLLHRAVIDIRNHLARGISPEILILEIDKFLNRINAESLVKVEEVVEEEFTHAITSIYKDGKESLPNSVKGGVTNELFSKGNLIIIRGSVSPYTQVNFLLKEASEKYSQILKRKAELKVTLKKDVEITQTDLKSSNLIAFGGIGENEIVEEYCDTFPWKLGRGSFTIGEEKFFFPEEKLIALSLNPLNEDYYFLLFYSCSPEMLIKIYDLPYMNNDFVVGNEISWLMKGIWDKSKDRWSFNKNLVQFNENLWKIERGGKWIHKKEGELLFSYPKDTEAEKNINQIKSIIRLQFLKWKEQFKFNMPSYLRVYLYSSEEEKESITTIPGKVSFIPSSYQLHLVINDETLKYGLDKIIVESV